MRGTVKFFDKNKGWGYITGMDGEDYFVHCSYIQTKGFRTLTAGDIVSFTPESTERGKKAAEVIPELTYAMVSRKAEKKGLHLENVQSPVIWGIVDENHVIQAGEKGMRLPEVDKYLS